MKFTPLHHFVHIEKVDFADLKKTKGGIHLPDNMREKAGAFKVLDAGPGFFDVLAGKRVPMSVKPDDYVLVDVNQVINVSYAGRDCYVVPEIAIFGTLDLSVEEPAPPESDEEKKSE